MKIASSSSPLQTLTVTRASADIRQWQPGQQLQATVLSDVSQGLVRLRIGTTILTAQLQADIKAGERLLLEVLSVGDKPVLRGISTDNLQQILDSAIRQVLPKQQSHAQLLSDLRVLLAHRQFSSLPQNLQQSIRQLVEAFVDRATISTATGVRQAMMQSGLFMETQLAARSPLGTAVLQQDIKAALLRVQQTIQQYLASPATASQQSTGLQRSYSPAPAQTTAVAVPQTLQTGFAPFTHRAVDHQWLQTGLLKPVLQTAASVAGSQAGNVLPTAIANASLSAPLSPASPGNTDGVRLPIAGNPPPTTASPQTIGRAILASAPLLAGHTTTAAASTLASQSDPLLSARLQGPLVYTANLPFRQSIDTDNSRPSARYSRLDSLTKVLTLFLKDADASLARIQLNQLSQHAVDGEQKPAWIFEIPVRHKDSLDLFQFRIERDKPQQQDQEADENTGWTVHIAFNIETLGQIHSKVNIHQQQVSIIFWTEEEHTTSAFIEHLQTLQQELEDCGLMVTHLNCIQGSPPQPAGTSIQAGVVDEQA